MKSSTFPCNRTYTHKFCRFKKAIAFFVFSVISLALIYNLQIIPALIPFARATASTEITKQIQAVIRKCISEKEYGEIVKLNYDNNGNVVSLQTDTASIAALTSDITEQSILALSENNKLNVAIPIGNLTGGAVFTGKGPPINIKVAISKKINCRIKNEFLESGINQTLHRIVIVVDTEIHALVPSAAQSTKVTTEYCVAETVIVGTVPEAYTKINRLNDELEESDIDDIFDFGASTK